MLNKELKAELDKFPDDLVVEVEGYAAGTETENKAYEITAVDGWQDEYGGKGITVWGRLVGAERITDEVTAENEQLRAALNELLALPGMNAHEGYPFFERIKKLAGTPTCPKEAEVTSANKGLAVYPAPMTLDPEIPDGWTLKTDGVTEEGDRMWNPRHEEWMPMAAPFPVGAPVRFLRAVITPKA